jgi:hypothetical protein
LVIVDRVAEIDKRDYERNHKKYIEVKNIPNVMIKKLFRVDI